MRNYKWQAVCWNEFIAFAENIFCFKIGFEWLKAEWISAFVFINKMLLRWKYDIVIHVVMCSCSLILGKRESGTT